VAWAPDYITLAQLKSPRLDMDPMDTSEDAELATHVTAASRAVDDWCHRQFGKVDTSEARYYEGVWDVRLCTYVHEIDDLYSATGLAVVNSTGAAVTGSTLWPRNALLKGMVHTQLRCSAPCITVTSSFWGWSAVPAPAVEATLIQASRLAKRKASPFGVAGSPSQGSELRLLARLDPDVVTTLGRQWRREVWAR